MEKYFYFPFRKNVPSRYKSRSLIHVFGVAGKTQFFNWFNNGEDFSPALTPCRKSECDMWNL